MAPLFDALKNDSAPKTQTFVQHIIILGAYCYAEKQFADLTIVAVRRCSDYLD